MRAAVQSAPAREWMLQRAFARDRDCDGRFLTGVTTTGIYCLPSCSARKPKPENVRFFTTRDDARAAGLRACRPFWPFLSGSEKRVVVTLPKASLGRLLTATRPGGFPQTTSFPLSAYDRHR